MDEAFRSGANPRNGNGRMDVSSTETVHQKLSFSLRIIPSSFRRFWQTIRFDGPIWD